MCINNDVQKIDDLFFYESTVFTHRSEQGSYVLKAISCVGESEWWYHAWVDENGQVRVHPQATQEDAIDCLVDPIAFHLCSHCEQATVEWVDHVSYDPQVWSQVERKSIGHWQCPECDSTYPYSAFPSDKY